MIELLKKMVRYWDPRPSQYDVEVYTEARNAVYEEARKLIAEYEKGIAEKSEGG
jgi:hypothetical protein